MLFDGGPVDYAVERNGVRLGIDFQHSIGLRCCRTAIGIMRAVCRVLWG